MELNGKNYELYKGTNLDCPNCCFEIEGGRCSGNNTTFDECNKYQVWKLSDDIKRCEHKNIKISGEFSECLDCGANDYDFR